VSFFSVWHYSKYTGGTYLACHDKIILNLVWSTGKYHVGHRYSNIYRFGHRYSNIYRLI